MSCTKAVQNVHDKQEYTGAFLGFWCTEVRKCTSSKNKSWSRAKSKPYMIFCLQLHQGDFVLFANRYLLTEACYDGCNEICREVGWGSHWQVITAISSNFGCCWKVPWDHILEQLLSSPLTFTETIIHCLLCVHGPVLASLALSEITDHSAVNGKKDLGILLKPTHLPKNRLTTSFS